MLKYAHGGIAMNTSNITNYKPKDFAELLGVSVKTLQRWDREGTLKVNRTPTDRRYYTYSQYLQFKGIDTENDTRQIVKERIEGGANEKAVWRLFINCPFVCINFDFFWLNKARQLYMDF